MHCLGRTGTEPAVLCVHGWPQPPLDGLAARVHAAGADELFG
jgi:hypothetical protein